jgi:hypothetical protein
VLQNGIDAGENSVAGFLKTRISPISRTFWADRTVIVKLFPAG